MSENNFPENWVSTTIGEVFDFLGGGTPSKNQQSFWNGKIPWASVKDIKGDYLLKTEDSITEEGVKNSATNIAQPGDVILVTRINPGKTITTKIKTAVNQDLKIVKPKFNTNPDFIKYLFSSKEKLFNKLSSGTTVLGISLNNLKEIEIPLPPLPEQHRIVAKIEELFSRLEKGIESLKTAQQQLKVYRQAVLKWAFEGRFTNKDVKEGELPEGWKWECANEIFNYVTSGSRGWAKYYSESGSIFLRMGNLDHNTIHLDLEDIQYVKLPNGTEGIRTLIHENDILISITADVGMVALVPKEFPEGYINQHIALARTTRSDVYPKYLAWYLTSNEKGQKQFHNLQRGATKVGLGLDDIKAVRIPVCSITEQQAIISEIEDRLSICDKIEESISQSIEQAEALRRSILKKAFEGKLVPQDPNDEPASVLLERIRAERESTQIAKGNGKRKSVKRG
ncbi:MAG: restriction endonuclease subunit S [Spirochaetales bacterium]|nr:restriction endonuclease subunit S [Spirochaetales bacterium]